MGNNNMYRNSSLSDNKSGYVGAPYNFIPFSRRVWEYDSSDITPHDAVGDDILSGEISYRITAKTPILVGAGLKKDDDKASCNIPEQFYRDNYGRYAIPGSSMRGLIRANTQILSLSSISDDIDDYELMFRSVASKKGSPNKDYYENILGAATKTVNNGKKESSVSVLLRVRAGYVKNEGGAYRIYDTALDQINPDFEMMNYFILSERKIEKEYKESKKTGKRFAYDFFIRNGRFITQNVITEGFVPYPPGANPPKGYHGTENKAYEPYSEACSYELSGRNVVAVGKPGEYSNEGYAVSTGNMRDKKAIYIIPRIDPNKKVRFDGEQLPIEISKEDERAFRIDLNKRSNTLKSNGGKEAFDLPAEDQVRPIFYIKLDGRLYFGFTPRLRLFYEYSIKKGVPQAHLVSQGDYSKAIFGYSNAKDSRKTRVSFSDAVVIEKTDNKIGRAGGVVDAILAEPKPTSFMDYVEPDPDKNGVTYNYQNFKLRGVKQYWLRDNALKDTGVTPDKKNKDFVSHFTPLPEGTEFEGKVRFHNLREDELGLLLWALQLNGKSYMNIGKAKAFGYGVIDLKVGEVRLLDAKTAYDFTEFSLNPYKKADKTLLIESYKNKLKDFLGGKNPEEFEPIRIFFAMKDPEHMPDPKKIRYMSIDAKEFQNRLTPLQTADEVLKITVTKQQREKVIAPKVGTINKSASTSKAGFAGSNGTISITKGGGSGSVQANQNEIVEAVVKDFNFGTAFLEKSEVLKENARVPKEYLKGLKPAPGDKIKVQYVEPRKKDDRVLSIYKIIT